MKKLFTFILSLLCVTAAMAQPSPGGGYTANSYSMLKTCVENAINNGIPNAKITLTADIYLSDGDGSPLCSTFSGTLDGDGHTIWAARPELTHDGGGHYARGFIFTHAKDATFKNLTYKNLLQGNPDWDNQAIITQDATNCTFDNITFDNVSVSCNKSNAGAIAGYAKDCKFTNITVMNSDFTAKGDNTGAVVGKAEDCEFVGIGVNNCFITVDGTTVGGVVGQAVYGKFRNCEIDDQSCIVSDGNGVNAYAGGVVGYLKYGEINNCVNSALVAGDDNRVGGIVGYADGNRISGTDKDETANVQLCLNTGMVISAKKITVVDQIYGKYKNMQMKCKTKYYDGKEYTVRIVDASIVKTNDNAFGGILGYADGEIVIMNCTNFGSLNQTDSSAGIIGEVYQSLDGGTGIIHCLSDFESEATGIYGIFADYPVSLLGSSDKHVNGCLNATTYYMCPEDDEEGITGLNDRDINYSILTWDNNHYVQEVTEAQITSGCVAEMLGSAWHQDLWQNRTPIPLENSKIGISLTRKLTDDFTAICLPFAVKSDEDVQYYKPQSAEYTDSKEIYHIKLVPVDMLAAGEPGFCRALNPGLTYTFRKATGDYQTDIVEYSISNPSAEGAPELSWTMKGTMYANLSDCGDTYYSLTGRELKNPETIAPYSAYFSGPSFGDRFGGLLAKFIYIVNHTSPYDVNFDDEVDVADVISFIHQGEDFVPFVSGSNEDNRMLLSEKIVKGIR